MPGAALAHDSRPLFIELTEAPGGAIMLRATTPATVDSGNAPVISMPPPCLEESRITADPLHQSARYRCDFDKASIAIDWPLYNPSISTLVRVVYASGETRTAVLDPSANEWLVPAPDSFAGVAASYFRIGLAHILGGLDHLLFLAGLLLIAGTPRRMLVTITGFTLTHSATLALAALGWLRVSIPATEAVIALSIVFLATEIARGDKTTLAWRRPVLVSSAFGLVHGAGFAAALGDIGLPKTETIAALLFFNLGVEAGQIAMIALVFAAVLAARRLLKPSVIANLKAASPVSARRAAGYALGIVSGYWFIERLAALMSV
ncbi:MAG: HupE/UreJ family protein [Pseudomonadota bacterium]